MLADTIDRGEWKAGVRTRGGQDHLGRRVHVLERFLHDLPGVATLSGCAVMALLPSGQLPGPCPKAAIGFRAPLALTGALYFSYADRRDAGSAERCIP
jgi:hypothetical protein